MSYFYNQQKQANPKPQTATGNEIEIPIVGVTYENRQNVIAKLQVGEQIVLRREPSNPFDSNAIRVENKNGEQLGFVSQDMASHLAPAFDLYGKPVTGRVAALIGGQLPGSSRGVRIRFTPPGDAKNSKLPSLEDLEL